MSMRIRISYRGLDPLQYSSVLCTVGLGAGNTGIDGITALRIDALMLRNIVFETSFRIRSCLKSGFLDFINDKKFSILKPRNS